MSYSKSSNKLILYLDGASEDIETSGNGDVTGTDYVMGLGGGYWNNPGNYFNGRLDEVRFWDVERSASEIANNKCSVTVSNELVLYYKFNEGEGINITDTSNSNLNSTIQGNYLWKTNDTSAPTVNLTSNPSSLTVSNSSVVTITATFSEAMAATPTLSLSGVVSNVVMSATSSASVWEYTWAVSTSLTSTTATVSGYDSAGNAYSGSDSLTFLVDSLAPTVILTHTLDSAENLISTTYSPTNIVTITASFSELMTPTPTISISDVVTDVSMTQIEGSNNFIYSWNTSSPTLVAKTYVVTVSGTDASGNIYSETDSLTFIVSPTFYLDTNGVTVKCYDCSVGEQGIINGKIYTAVDNNTIKTTEEGNWDKIVTSLVTDMNYLFKDNNGFNEDISSWDTSNVTTMNAIFQGANTFNKDIGDWDVSKVTDFTYAFFSASNFNQDISNWNTVSANSLSGMFHGASSFNQNIGGWNVSNVTSMEALFLGATSFNGNIDSWNTSKVTNMSKAFQDATSFSQNINSWNTSSVLKMNGMFHGASTFNSSISNWDTSSVNDMSYMFFGASKFNQNIGGWNTTNVTLMDNMFNGAVVFNQDLSDWCVTEIDSQPSDFAGQSDFSNYSNKFPNWGYCGPPVTLSLSSNLTNQITYNSDQVEIIATFSEAMSSTPTISLSGIIDNAVMSKTSTSTKWTFSWTVSTSQISTTATISGTSLSGKPYSGNESLTFTISEESLLIHYDLLNTSSYNQQTTTVTNNTINDISGNDNDGFIPNVTNVSYDSNENALYFNGDVTRDGQGLFIKNLNYVSGSSDQLEEITIVAKVKAKSIATNHPGDERIIFSFDRSTNFRFSIGSDISNIRELAKGKMVFHFTNSDGTHDIYDINNTSDLRDDNWHELMIQFKADTPGGLRFYIDGVNTFTDPNSYSPIGNQNSNETPRYGIIGNGNEMTTEGGTTGPDDMFYGWIQKIKYYSKSLSPTDNIPPNVNLTTTSSNLNVYNASTVTITATFSEAMIATPTLSLSGIVSNTFMSATSSSSVWEYTWTVSTVLTSTTATVSGSDMSGNAYFGSESLTFSIQDITPPLILTASGTTFSMSEGVTNVTSFTADKSVKWHLDATKDYALFEIDPNTGALVFSSAPDYETPQDSDVNNVYELNILATDTSSNTGSQSISIVIENVIEIPDGSLTINDTEVDDTKAKINWEYTEGTHLITGFTLWVRVGRGGPWSSVTVINTTLDKAIREYTLENLDSGQLYSFRLWPINSDGTFKTGGEPGFTTTVPDTTLPTVTFSVNPNSLVVSQSSTIEIIAHFSESMAATPTLSLSGIVSNEVMSATSSASVWKYAWTVSTSLISTTATVSGTDLAGNAYSGSDSLTFTIEKRNATILLSDITKTYGDADFSVSAQSSSSGDFTYSVADTSVATINGDVISIAGAGTTILTATQVADDQYKAQTTTITLTINKASPTIVFNDLNKEYGDPDFSLSALSSSTGTFTYSVSDTSVATIDGPTITLVGTGSTTISVFQVADRNYSAASAQMTLNVKDETTPTLSLTHDIEGFTVTGSETIGIYAAFSEAMQASPSISIGSLLIDQYMTIMNEGETNKWSYQWEVPQNFNGTVSVTVSGYDLAGNLIKGTDPNFEPYTVDNKAPEILSVVVDNANAYIEVLLNEGLYLDENGSSGLAASRLLFTQTSGFDLPLKATSVLTRSGGTPAGGETYYKILLDLEGKKPLGNETYQITTNSNTILTDDVGNVLQLSTQEKNNFQLNAAASGEVSVAQSELTVVPDKLILSEANETVVIRLQTKDSSGLNFVEGGYPIKIFGPNGMLVTTDQNDGTYTASYSITGITAKERTEVFYFLLGEKKGNSEAVLTILKDTDKDRVPDITDECANTPIDEEVDALGCSLSQKDTDEDGIPDSVDLCPNTPKTELIRLFTAGATDTISNQLSSSLGNLVEKPAVVDETGCSVSQKDTDGDGVNDAIDNCKETPNPNQADKDGDGIGDVCDDDNPLPIIQTVAISFDQKPENGTVLGILVASDPEGETLSFSINSSLFDGIIGIDPLSGALFAINGSLLTAEDFNDKTLFVRVSDGTNELVAEIVLNIKAEPEPPEISITTNPVSEDAEVGFIVGSIQVTDPQQETFSIVFDGGGLFELTENNEIILIDELDYETQESHNVAVVATNKSGLATEKGALIAVVDVPNTSYTGKFMVAVFDVNDESLGAKVNYKRYFNPHNKGVGKWKVRKKISGGADADKFVIKGGQNQKNEDNASEGYLDFITPPDFENPGDANGDNIYEVEVTYENLEDGAPQVPVPVTQSTIFVPENDVTAIELQSNATEPDQDTDGDGVVDVLDNSPLVSNPDQVDEDGDGVGDVSDDFDHDGVWNPFDECPDTPLGELVGLDGCIIFYLPPNNFKLYKTEKCAQTNSIAIDVVDTTHTYVMTLSGPGTNRTESFSDSTFRFDGLGAGTYSLYVTVDGVSSGEFERFFEVTIREPEPLSIYAGLSNKSNNLTLSMKGGQVYNITHNGKTTQTSKSEITLTLKNGNNAIRVDTGLECQGVFAETFFKSSAVQIAPNPFNDEINIFVGGEDRDLKVDIFTPGGSLIHTEQCRLDSNNRVISIPTSNYPQGSYNVTIQGETTLQSIQVVKE